MNKILMALGESTVLPGTIWTLYDVELLDKKMVCTNHMIESINFLPKMSLKFAPH